MARPPIIISNGGVFEELVKDCGDEENQKIIIAQMKINLKELNDKARNGEDGRPIIRKIESDHKKDPKFIWCLESEIPRDLKQKLKDFDIQDPHADFSG